MKKLALFLAIMAGSLTSLSAYTWKDFIDDVANDTKERQGTINSAYFYDLQEDGDARNKFGVSITVISYKFISFDPALVYTPDKANNKCEFALSFPLRIGEIPLPSGDNIRQAYERRYGKTEKTDTVFDNLFVGPYFYHNFYTDRFGYGGMAGVKMF